LFHVFYYQDVLTLLLATEMSHLKVMNASRGCIHKYENLKRKLYNSNANIYFNQQCLQKQLIPNYTRMLKKAM